MLMELMNGREKSRMTPRFWPNQLQGGIFCLRSWGMLRSGAQFWTPTWQMPANHQGELVQGSQPSESEVQGRGPGLGGPRGGEGRNCMQIVCLFVLYWVQDPHQIPGGVWDPRPGGPLVRGVRLLRKCLGGFLAGCLFFTFHL